MTTYSRYGAAFYSSFQYGEGTADKLAWVIDVDWDEDGSYDGVNEAVFCIGYQLERGRQFYLAAPGQNGFEAFQPSRLTLTLLNTDNRYDPFNTSGPYYPNVDVGKFIKVQVQYEGETYDRFAGIIEDMQPSRQGGLEVVQLTALDGWKWLATHYTQRAVETSKASDAAISAILTDADWPTIWGSTIGSGAETLGYWWEDYRPASEAIKDITDSENGRFWIGADGSANFESRQTAGTKVIELTEEELGKEVMLEMPWEAERNIVRIIGHPIKDEGTQVLWTLQDTPQVASGESLEIIVDFKYENIPCAGTNLVTPVSTTDYTMNSQADGGGTDHTSNFTVTIEETWGMSALLKYANGGGSASYITHAQLRADALTMPDAVQVDDDARTGSEQPRFFLVDSKHIQSTTNIPVLADYYKTFVTETKKFPTVRLRGRWDKQFTPDILNRVGLHIPTKGIEDKSYRVGYIQETWIHPSGQDVETVISFEHCEEIGTVWRIGTVGAGELGVNTYFGF